MNAMTTTKQRKRGKRRPGVAPLPDVITSTGLEFRYRRGDVEIEHVADPAQPNRTVSRPMASAVGRLRARRAITVHQANAADKYGELREIETGACWVGGEQNGARMPFWQKGHPSITQVQASASLRRIHEIVGPRGRLILGMLIVENMDVRSIAMAHGRVDPLSRAKTPASEQLVKGWVDAVLTRLVEHFGLDGRSY
jgi:hypothetical protein